MTKTDKDLEKLLKDIEQAKAKLSNTMQAINSAKLEYESKQNDIKSLSKEIKQLLSEIDGLKVNKNNIEMSISSLGELYESQRKKYDGETIVLNDNLAKISNNIVSEREMLSELEELHKTRKSEMESEFRKTEEELNRTIKSQLKYLEDISDNIIKKTEQESKLNDIISDLVVRIEEKKQEEVEQTKVLSNIIENTNKNDRLIREIEQAENDIKLLNNDIEVNKKLLLGIQNEKNKAEFELREFEKGQSEYIRNKMEIKREREELKGKEEYIKEKYEAAGLKYL